MPKKISKSTETTKAAPRTKQSRSKTKSSAEASAAVSASTSTGLPRRETPSVVAPTEEQIRARAYELFRKGVNPSDPIADWIQAERELGSGATL